MVKPKDETNPIAKAGATIAVLALVPALCAFAYLRDDSSAEARRRADHVAAQEAKYRQMEYDAIDRRLGNAQR